MTARPSRREDGFTLTELLVAITLLGIIMGVIGAMITTAFRTSTIVSARLNGSRGPKMVSRYWVPDVEQAETVSPGAAGCGSGGAPVVTFTSHAAPSAFDDPAATGVGDARTITWWDTTNGAREQLIRWVCDGGTSTSLPVVADLHAAPTVGPVADGKPVVITVEVPDRAEPTKVYTFHVGASQQVSPGVAP